MGVPDVTVQNAVVELVAEAPIPGPVLMAAVVAIVKTAHAVVACTRGA